MRVRCRNGISIILLKSTFLGLGPTLVGFREDTSKGKSFALQSFPRFHIRFTVDSDTENSCAAIVTEPFRTLPLLLSFNKKWKILRRCSFVRFFLFLVGTPDSPTCVVSSRVSVIVSGKQGLESVSSSSLLFILNFISSSSLLFILNSISSISSLFIMYSSSSSSLFVMNSIPSISSLFIMYSSSSSLFVMNSISSSSSIITITLINSKGSQKRCKGPSYNEFFITMEYMRTYESPEVYE
ncbi:hypothetical protein C5167_047683 [Papaver somniferum]|uniref:Uncharacterized protein n=1 Tax=Papaver somniferum TaxID=3469 RepID=A0A4Y7LK89_PAPSO|nr:hypothetical protein C5167_047683 [Papaver somniferum]